MSKISLPVFCLLALLVAANAAAQKPSAPQFLFGADTVSVTGITPGADVYLYGVAREPMGFYNQIVTREETLHDPSRSGRVDYKLTTKVAARSIWFAVDLASGSATAGSPPGYAPQLVQLDGRHLKKDLGGEISQLSFEGAMVDILVVRPGEGVWGGPVSLHGKNDENPSHGFTDVRTPTISTGRLELRPGTKAQPPLKLKNGDVVFMMNSWAAQYAWAVIGGGGK